MALGGKKAAFAAEFVKDMNATKAAKRAGYSPKTAYTRGHELKNDPDVKEAIRRHREAIADQLNLELADILIYLVRLAERLDIDLVDAANRKMAINAERYPRDKVRGDARRASEYDD